MNRVVKEHYPAQNLPEDLREGFGSAELVRVTIEVVRDSQTVTPGIPGEPGWFQRPARVLTLEEIFALRRPPFRSAEEIDEELRRERDAWDD